MPSSLLFVRIPFISHLLNTILLRYIPLSGYLMHIIFHHSWLNLAHSVQLSSDYQPVFVRLFSRTGWATPDQHE